VTYQSASVDDNVPLTPNNFLRGQVGAPEVIDESGYDPKRWWKQI